MDADYFMHACTITEAVLCIEGFRARQHVDWARSRYQSYYSAAPHLKNFKFENMGEFPWEKEPEAPMDAATQQAELDALRQRARIRDEHFLNEQQEKWQEQEICSSSCCSVAKVSTTD